MTRDQTGAMVRSDQADDDAVESNQSNEITKDDLFHVLQNERRRRVLKYLVTNGEGPFEMRTIAEHVAAAEHGTTVQALTSDQRQRVYIALYQSHLPKLDEKGFIDYNQSRGIVEKRPLVEETREHLGDVDGEPNPDDAGDDEPDSEPTDVTVSAGWRKSFVGVTAMSGLLVVALWTNVLTGLSGLAVATVVVALFAVLGIGLIGRDE